MSAQGLMAKEPGAKFVDQVVLTNGTIVTTKELVKKKARAKTAAVKPKQPKPMREKEKKKKFTGDDKKMFAKLEVSKDLAETQEQTDAIAEILSSAFLGHCNLPVNGKLNEAEAAATGIAGYKYEYGAFNTRAIDEPSIKTLRTQFKSRGLQAAANPLIIMVDPNEIDISALQQKISAALTPLKPLNASPGSFLTVQDIAGAHRIRAASDELKELHIESDYIAGWEKDLAAGVVLTDASTETISNLRSSVDQRIKSYRMWPANVYNMKILTQKGNEYAGRFLASNERNFQLVATESETLVMHLRPFTAQILAAPTAATKEEAAQAAIREISNRSVQVFLKQGHTCDLIAHAVTFPGFDRYMIPNLKQAEVMLVGLSGKLVVDDMMKSIDIMNKINFTPDNVNLDIWTVDALGSVEESTKKHLSKFVDKRIAEDDPRYLHAIKQIHNDAKLALRNVAVEKDKFDDPSHDGLAKVGPAAKHVDAVFTEICENFPAIGFFTKSYLKHVYDQWALVHPALELLVVMVEPLWPTNKPGTKARDEFRLPDGSQILHQRITTANTPQLGRKAEQFCPPDELTARNHKQIWIDYTSQLKQYRKRELPLIVDALTNDPFPQFPSSAQINALFPSSKSIKSSGADNNKADDSDDDEDRRIDPNEEDDDNDADVAARLLSLIAGSKSLILDVTTNLAAHARRIDKPPNAKSKPIPGLPNTVEAENLETTLINSLVPWQQKAGKSTTQFRYTVAVACGSHIWFNEDHTVLGSKEWYTVARSLCDVLYPNIELALSPDATDINSLPSLDADGTAGLDRARAHHNAARALSRLEAAFHRLPFIRPIARSQRNIVPMDIDDDGMDDDEEDQGIDAGVQAMFNMLSEMVRTHMASYINANIQGQAPSAFTPKEHPFWGPFVQKYPYPEARISGPDSSLTQIFQNAQAVWRASHFEDRKLKARTIIHLHGFDDETLLNDISGYLIPPDHPDYDNPLTVRELTHVESCITYHKNHFAKSLLGSDADKHPRNDLSPEDLNLAESAGGNDPDKDPDSERHPSTPKPTSSSSSSSSSSSPTPAPSPSSAAVVSQALQTNLPPMDVDSQPDVPTDDTPPTTPKSPSPRRTRSHSSASTPSQPPPTRLGPCGAAPAPAPALAARIPSPIPEETTPPQQSAPSALKRKLRHSTTSAPPSPPSATQPPTASGSHSALSRASTSSAKHVTSAVLHLDDDDDEPDGIIRPSKRPKLTEKAPQNPSKQKATDAILFRKDNSLPAPKSKSGKS